MGGGGDKKQVEEEKKANPTFTGQMRTFGAGQAGLIQQQLNQAGLGGMVDPSQFQQTTLPIFTRPDEVILYLQSQGLTPATVNAATATQSAEGGSSEVNPYSKYSEDF